MGSAPRSATRLGSARRLPIRPMVVPRARPSTRAARAVARSRGACRRRRASDQGSRLATGGPTREPPVGFRSSGSSRRCSRHRREPCLAPPRGRPSRPSLARRHARISCAAPGDLLRTVHPEPAGNRPDVFLAGVRAVDRHEREPSLGRIRGLRATKGLSQGRHRIVDVRRRAWSVIGIEHRGGRGPCGERCAQLSRARCRVTRRRRPTSHGSAELQPARGAQRPRDPPRERPRSSRPAAGGRCSPSRGGRPVRSRVRALRAVPRRRHARRADRARRPDRRDARGDRRGGARPRRTG